MIGRIFSVISAVLVIIQQVLRARERRRLEEDAARQAELDAEYRRGLDDVEEDPAAWFADHFGGGDVVDVVRAPVPPVREPPGDSGETGADGDPAN